MAGALARSRERRGARASPRWTLDAVAEEVIRDGGGAARPSWATTASPASICASVNDQVVHGIPGDRVLRDGDLVSIDCGAIVDGWHGDSAITVRR